MELKHFTYGSNGEKYTFLLIVPYGIETTWGSGWYMDDANLLIVPYGIETMEDGSYFKLESLLIVPYGIETAELADDEELRQSFNCTLWN